MVKGLENRIFSPTFPKDIFSKKTVEKIPQENSHKSAARKRLMVDAGGFENLVNFHI